MNQHLSVLVTSKNQQLFLAVVGILITLLLLTKNVPGAVFYGLVVTAVVGIIAGVCGVKGMPEIPTGVISFDFDFSLVGAFASGLGELTSHPQCYVAIFSLLFVDFFRYCRDFSCCM